MNDTPETDAAIKESSKWRMPFISCIYDNTTLDGPVAALCRRLEKERNQAVESLKNTSRGTERLSKSNQFLLRELIQCRKERDDLKERLNDLLSTRPLK